MSESERELEGFLTEELFGDKPRSVGEALAEADEQAEVEAPEEPETPIEVEDEPGEAPVPPPPEPAPTVPDEEPEEEEGEVEDQHVVWAKKKYGDDDTKWAKAAYDMEQHISRIAGEKKEAEALAVQWYEYAQEVEANVSQQASVGMPLSSQEEQWVEQAVMNPLHAARQAAHAGNVSLYNAVIGRIAEENPMMAGQIGAQVQVEMQQLAEQQNGAQQYAPSQQETMQQSISRLGIDIQTYGEAMSQKVGELGEYHPYVQAILEGDPGQRDLAFMAVYDLVRTSSMSTRRVRDSEHEERVRQEADLRRQAAGVVTGGPTQPPPPKEDPFMQAMEREWVQRGQWQSDE